MPVAESARTGAAGMPLSRPLPPLARIALAVAGGVAAAAMARSIVGHAASTTPVVPAPLLWAAGALGIGLLTMAAGRRQPVWPGFVLLGFGLGAVALDRAAADCRVRLADETAVRVRGVFESAAPERSRLRVNRLVRPDAGGVCRGTMRVRIRRPADAAGLPAGARVEVVGRWWTSTRARRAGEPPEWAGMLLADSITVVAGARPWSTAAMRVSAQRRLDRLLGERAALGAALVLAARAGLDPAVRDRFTRAGLAHVLAISGMHVGMIAAALLLLGRVLRLPARTTAFGTVGVTAAYVAFLGMPHAATRAALQITALLSGRLLQRPGDPFAAISAAALVLLACDPLALFSPGFQLSFAGTTGIVALRRSLLAAVPFRRGRIVWDGLATSAAATIATAPLAALHFDRIAPIGIVASVAAAPLVAIAVPAVAVALGLGLVSEAAAGFVAGAARLALGGLATVADAAAAVPGGSTYIARDTVIGWLAAAALAMLLARRPGPLRRLGRRTRRVAIAGLALAVATAWPVATHAPAGALEIHMIDVGQGDAIAIRSPRARWLLVDAGLRSGDYDAGRARVVPFLLRSGARRLDALVLTHPHADHIGGAAAVLDAVRVGAIIDPGMPVSSSQYLELLGRVRDGDTRWIAARPGRRIEWDGVVLSFLYPDDDAVDAPDDANNVSVVFRLAYGEFAALFTGDSPAEVEERLVERYGDGLRSAVLKVGHHGSATSTGSTLLEAVRPEIALISVGRRNRYGHPDAVVTERLRDRGVRTLRTDRAGTIRVRGWPDGRYALETER